MAAAETQSTSPKKFEVCGYICSESAGNSAVFHTGLLLTAPPPPPTVLAIFFVLADMKQPSHFVFLEIFHVNNQSNSAFCSAHLAVSRAAIGPPLFFLGEGDSQDFARGPQ